MSTNPNVMLMDEPFGALDQITRDRLNLELLVLSQRQQMTVLFVTHSIREAVLLSDRVVVMTPRPGCIAQVLDIDLPRPRTLYYLSQTKRPTHVLRVPRPVHLRRGDPSVLPSHVKLHRGRSPQSHRV